MNATLPAGNTDALHADLSAAQLREIEASDFRDYKSVLDDALEFGIVSNSDHKRYGKFPLAMLASEMVSGVQEKVERERHNAIILKQGHALGVIPEAVHEQYLDYDKVDLAARTRFCNALHTRIRAEKRDDLKEPSRATVTYV